MSTSVAEVEWWAWPTTLHRPRIRVQRPAAERWSAAHAYPSGVDWRAPAASEARSACGLVLPSTARPVDDTMPIARCVRCRRATGDPVPW